MAETYKNDQGGVTLILTLIVMSLLLFLGIYFMSFALADYKISFSHAQAVQGYYLAEAGLHEMIYKLKNDDAYRVPFETDSDWSATLSRNNVFNTGESYSISIRNNSQAHAQIVATSSISLLDATSAQRVTQTDVFKALGQSPVQDSSGYADGNIEISASIVNFHNGSARSNNIFDVKFAGTVAIDKDLNATGNFLKSWASTVMTSGVNVDSDSSHVHAANYPPAAAPINMPGVDFDSTSPNSYKNRAIATGVYHTSSAFETLMRNNQNLTLNEAITYVDGDVKLCGGQNLIINGVLAIGRDLIVGQKYGCWSRYGLNSITVNHATGQPAGILAKRKIYFETSTGTININGIIYANDQLSVAGIPFGMNFETRGGMISRKLTITSFWRPLNIYYDNAILAEVLGATEFSPVVNIEHWEEEY
ncbi:hypothetical protein COU00_01705 [Candidatus Falkowbacteria bacterium CG10_big_fil_rev_8_21_14_0_10_43_11]|uniref:Type 4 fimbrial biogenesis protein PilX N-terminal domain-containing protein n=1 Tax=Candidatus Falkowbacteria bacterium CG10_big_fil_rev_8_21_14_0_10_43_11 TaxID=1974568 RepID=A0A2M6WMA1_9BACT|nr:MAG: hypothetical protein COU00_01705 [Candidatus Falkowbacteria bacterium CG10_big_fil_rev_8_21_14_0_10_43_11]